MPLLRENSHTVRHEQPACYGSELRITTRAGATLHCCLPGAIALIEQTSDAHHAEIACLLSITDSGELDGMEFCSESIGEHPCDLHSVTK